jgi:hypothetical protein
LGREAIGEHWGWRRPMSIGDWRRLASKEEWIGRCEVREGIEETPSVRCDTFN